MFIPVLRTILLLGLLASFSAEVSASDKRVALVIGNAAYQHTPALQNPKNDASDIAGVLRGLGFEVIEAHDLDKSGMDRKIREFAETLSDAKVGLFYYAGHGLQVGQQNYLVPVDAKLTTAGALDFEMLRLDLIHRTMERETSTNILILDACRDNPLSRNLARALGTRSTEIGRGLAAVESGEGTLISFSTQPGSVALDGEGRNSPYATALVKNLTATDDDISSILINVRNEVMQATNRRQVPWEHSALTARFYFSGKQPAGAAFSVLAPEAGAVPNPSPAAQIPTYEQQSEMAFWGAVKDSGERSIIQTYLARFPNGTFAGLARAMIEKMEREEVQKAELEARREELKKAEEAKKNAEASIGEASRKADAAQLRAEELRKAKDEALQAAQRQLSAAQKAVEDARRAAEQAKTEREALSSSDAASTSPVSSPTAIAALSDAAPMVHSSTDTTAMARILRRELKRVGCRADASGGAWSSDDRIALSNFAKHAKLDLPVDLPGQAALNAVLLKDGRICPAQCDDEEVEKNGECVARQQAREPTAKKQASRSANSREETSNSSRQRTSRGSRSRRWSGNESWRERRRDNNSAVSSAAGLIFLKLLMNSNTQRHRRHSRRHNPSGFTSPNIR